MVKSALTSITCRLDHDQLGQENGKTSLILNYHSFAKTDFFGSLSKGGKSAKKVGLPVGKPVVNLKFGSYFEFSVPLQSLIKKLLSLIMAQRRSDR
jgi:hypothetical protein